MTKLGYPLIISILVFLFSCTSETKKTDTQNNEEIVLAFLADIHLQPENNAIEGFKKLIEDVNALEPDFIIAGGDMIMDALGQTEERADSLYRLYSEMIKMFKAPVYNTIGNHELFGIYEKSGIDQDHPYYGKKMYEKYLGEKYYSFRHKAWQFFILDVVQETEDRRYRGYVDSLQMLWIKRSLDTLDTNIAIAISVHIPLITLFSQIKYGSLTPNTEGLVVNNSKEVLDLFEKHNLKLVLQGHLHTLEHMYSKGIHFITGGAVSGKWWQGPNEGLEEGYLIVRLKGDKIQWEYRDYGWEIQEDSTQASINP
jgi:3',5'-cyclic-AMP phosphodiesterase